MRYILKYRLANDPTNYDGGEFTDLGLVQAAARAYEREGVTVAWYEEQKCQRSLNC